MASEKTLLRVLDLITNAPTSELESLRAGATSHAKSIRRIVERPNVVAVGISEKETKGKSIGKLALTFYVERKVPPAQLRGNAMIPPTVPEALTGSEAVPTDVVVLGKLVPEVNATRSPVQPGNSIGHTRVTAGTLGALVRKGSTRFLLSNSHVFALSGKAKKGDSIIYPGDADGGSSPTDVIGTLADFKKFVVGGDFVNRVDCAIVTPSAARLPDVVSAIKGLGVPKGTIKAVRGMKVVKVGRTTGKTFGEVRDVNLRFVMPYPGVGDVGFLDQVLCTRYTKPGDSGSLVIDQKTGRAAGLHFAGANGGSVFSPITDVLDTLKIRLVTTAVGDEQSARRKGKGKRSGATKAKSAGRTREKHLESGDPRPVSERDANRARETHSDLLRDLGAHAIGIEEIRQKGRTTFVIVAYIEKDQQALPKSLRIGKGKAARAIAVVTRKSPQFKPE